MLSFLPFPSAVSIYTVCFSATYELLTEPNSFFLGIAQHHHWQFAKLMKISFRTTITLRSWNLKTLRHQNNFSFALKAVILREIDAPAAKSQISKETDFSLHMLILIAELLTTSIFPWQSKPGGSLAMQWFIFVPTEIQFSLPFPHSTSQSCLFFNFARFYFQANRACHPHSFILRTWLTGWPQNFADPRELLFSILMLLFSFNFYFLSILALFRFLFSFNF